MVGCFDGYVDLCGYDEFGGEFVCYDYEFVDVEVECVGCCVVGVYGDVELCFGVCWFVVVF